MPLVETRELRFGQLALRFALAHAGAAADRLGLPKGVPEAARFAAEAQEVTVRYGDAEERIVHGEASLNEARDLIEEGIPVAPIPGLPRTDS